MASSEKKVLIVTYYWPPSGASGVQRWLKFVKYLPQFGWQPYVFTPENPVFQIRDDSLIDNVPAEAEVLHFPIWEPDKILFNLSKRLGGKSAKPKDVVENRRASLFSRFITWVRATFFVPDPRIFWVRPSVKFLHSFLRDNQISIVVTTGPPHSMHLIGLRLKQTNPSLRWVADFRDPWSEWGLLDDLRVSRFVRRRHKRMERRVLSAADEVIAVTPSAAKRFEELGGRTVKLITNGYDEDDFSNLKKRRSKKFVICHAGVLNENRDPSAVLDAVRQLMSEDQSFADAVRVLFIGDVHRSLMNRVANQPELSSVVEFKGNVSHKEVIETYGGSAVLLLILSDFQNAGLYIPGKLFEYLAAGLPILGLGPTDSDAGYFLNEMSAGRMMDRDDVEGIRDFLKRQFAEWKSHDTRDATAAASQWSRRQLTSQLSELLQGLL